MDNTTSTSDTSSSATGATPFPAGNGSSAGTARPAASNTPVDTAASAAQPADAMDAAAPIVDRLIKRAASSAHDAVDSVAAKVSSVAGGLQGGVSKAGDARDEWIESARDLIRQHPFATVAGALVIGAALLSLSSSRKD